MAYAMTPVTIVPAGKGNLAPDHGFTIMDKASDLVYRCRYKSCDPRILSKPVFGMEDTQLVPSYHQACSRCEWEMSLVLGLRGSKVPDQIIAKVRQGQCPRCGNRMQLTPERASCNGCRFQVEPSLM